MNHLCLGYLDNARDSTDVVPPLVRISNLYHILLVSMIAEFDTSRITENFVSTHAEVS